MSSEGYDSEVSEMNDIGSSFSSMTSLNIPPMVTVHEKKPVGRTTSFPLEQVQKSNQQRRESETARQKLTEGIFEPRDVYDWWTDEVSENKKNS